MRMRVALCAVFAGMLLGGCKVLGGGGAEPETIYVLRAAETPAAAPGANGVLSVLRPLMQPGLDTDRIALTRQDHELDYFAAVRWSDSLPRLLGAVTVQTFGGGGGFATVVDSSRAAVISDYDLLLTVRHFEAAYRGDGGVPVVRVALECVLTASGPRRVLGRCDADETEPAGENRSATIVAALERATQRALASARTQALAAVAADVRR